MDQNPGQSLVLMIILGVLWGSILLATPLYQNFLEIGSGDASERPGDAPGGPGPVLRWLGWWLQ